MFYAHLDPVSTERVLKACNKVAATSMLVATELLPKKMSRSFITFLIDAVVTQKYSVGYPQYHPVYWKWKLGHSFNPHMFWVLGSDFLNNLTTFATYQGWFAGIPKEVKDKGWKSYSKTKQKRKHIAAYGWIMEEGGDYSADRGGDHPARPLFVPALKDYKMTQARADALTMLPMIERAWS